jgi:ABC-type nickel/cobalt efflux system permease component RcnA
MAWFEAEQREALIYLADLGLAICSAALLVNLLLAIVDLDT